ncbi:heme biosynthesis operon protein HemX [Alteromonas pelagimontana]|uniref:Heme biosynthesis operon protein HemX n=1 Tax=Alteromonas pelagimontana TaxID=1858656 RepID=A0A6M4MDP1_9ALTE|nr:uroporphyrinogen-III C-methyltransferase [Alteromonas pelagimontana]QJR81137.1 heme biosynthesis operon protein HemX [Alteromonas pelagimontana]
MADKKDNNQDSDALIPVTDEQHNETTTANTASPASPASKKAHRHRSRGGLWTILLLTLLLTLALAGAGYWYVYQRQSDNQALYDAQVAQQQKLEVLNRTNTTLQQQLKALETSKTELAKSVNDLVAKSETLSQQSEQALAEIQNMEGRRPADWLIAEADYLVRMAGRKLWLEQDIRTAIMLLSNADQRLQELTDPSVLPVRKLIAQDIQMLQQLNPVSHTSIALTLSGLLAQIDNLPLDTFEKPEQEATKDQVSESVSDWKQNLAAVWHSITDQFISVTRNETPVEPLMSEQQQWLAREQLKLQLMQAQSAAMNRQNDLYQQSLQSATALLEKKFAVGESEIKGFLREVQKLAAADVSQTLPQQMESQAPLQELLESRVEKVFGQGASAL